MQGLLLKPQFPSPGVVWGRKEGLGRALASSEALLDVQQVLCEREKPAPKTDQDTRGPAPEANRTPDTGHHATPPAEHSTWGRTAPRAGSSRQEVDVDGAGGASGPATPPSVGKPTNCRSRGPRLPSP